MRSNLRDALGVTRIVGWGLPVLLSGLAASASAAPSRSDTSSGFMQHYRRGLELAQREEWTDAIAEFQRAYDARETPKPELHLYIARAHLRLGSGTQALDAYQRFLREAKVPKPEQLKDVTAGIRRAKELMDLQAQRDRLAAQQAALAAQQQERAEQTKQAEAPVLRRAADPEPTAPKVSVVARNGQTPYAVAIGPDSMCTAPCQMQAPAGEQMVTVMGPGSKRFQRSVLFPSEPSRLTVQHFTLSRAIAGPILLVLSAPFLAGGVLSLSGTSSSVDPGIISGASLMFVHGAVFFFTGIGQLAAIKSSSITVEPVASGPALRTPRLQITSAGIAPLSDRKGAMAGVTLRF